MVLWTMVPVKILILPLYHKSGLPGHFGQKIKTTPHTETTSTKTMVSTHSTSTSLSLNRTEIPVSAVSTSENGFEESNFGQCTKPGPGLLALAHWLSGHGLVEIWS